MLAGLGYLWVQARILAARRAAGRKAAPKKKAGPRFALPGKKKHLKLVVDNNEDDDRDSKDPTWH
jgi:hypothetical protein